MTGYYGLHQEELTPHFFARTILVQPSSHSRRSIRCCQRYLGRRRLRHVVRRDGQGRIPTGSRPYHARDLCPGRVGYLLPPTVQRTARSDPKAHRYYRDGCVLGGVGSPRADRGSYHCPDNQWYHCSHGQQVPPKVSHHLLDSQRFDCTPGSFAPRMLPFPLHC